MLLVGSGSYAAVTWRGSLGGIVLAPRTTPDARDGQLAAQLRLRTSERQAMADRGCAVQRSAPCRGVSLQAIPVCRFTRDRVR